jgi:two-component system, cell cycle response regulator DivK
LTGAAATGSGGLMPRAPAPLPLVLLVDDHPDNREVYQEYLSRSGFRVQTAADGGDALHKAAAELPDVVVMDLAMPGMDGWEATRRLRSRGATREIPIIVLSAHTTEGERRKAEDAACDAFLAKPLAPDVLDAAVRMMLRRRRR